MSTYHYGTCDVCKHAKHDTSKKLVLYCPSCDAWICDDCRPNIVLRGIAMIKRALSR